MILVDDDEDVVRALRKVLKKAGYRVVATKSPHVALRMVEGANPDHFDLAVIDIFLGSGMSGFQLARSVCDLQPEAGIVMISGLLGTELPPHGLPDDRVEFLEKPLAVDELIDAANRRSPRTTR